ncbi:hypothetical protein Poli38472_013271 [Pythium oligandrum]|uniref:Leucine zipper transcription factor-like protein 1 n=1 Tax=Pythium oligandrum TaxID=41045 RepID=A0A8K1F9M6_PYTOL|nr:hypothetical protein Poli38472_013271 [Pythium oligandrum]|eukprot:TMW55380.1 hypothetical protein Poli38472_013271 [Pythium oligandrum]
MGAAASDYFTSYADVQYGYLDAELATENLHMLAARGDYHRVSVRMKKGMDPNGRVFFDDDAYEREDTVMICAARGDMRRKGRKRHIKTLEVLRRFGGDVSLYNTLEQTALYVACERDLFRVAQWLIDHGADVNKCSKAGVSPLLCAYRNANAELVALLLDRGARAIDPPKSFSALQITKFLKFFRSRLRTHLENVDAEFEDTRSDRLSSDDVYSQKDVKDVISSLCYAVKANIRGELQDTINMMALLLRQIFSEAEHCRLTLELDIGQVEDKELLERVEKLSVAEWADEENSAASKASKKASASVSPSKLQQQMAKEQEERERAFRDREKQHEEEICAALHTSKSQQEEHAKEVKRLQRKLQDARDTIEELEQKVEDASQHVSQTTQFQSMKKMVTQKNQQLQDLRRRLQRYEPDVDDGETKDADDDDDN